MSEARLLRWDEVDMTAGILLLANTKTGASRRPLSAEALVILSSIEPVDGNPYVFAGHRDGHPIGVKQLNQAHHRVCRAAKIEGLKLLDLRRTFLSDAIAGWGAAECGTGGGGTH